MSVFEVDDSRQTQPQPTKAIYADFSAACLAC